MGAVMIFMRIISATAVAEGPRLSPIVSARIPNMMA
jgi:hypothetical protein